MIEFQDNSIKVKAVLDESMVAFLYEVAGELEAQAKENMPTGHWNSQIKNAWGYKVDEEKGIAYVGNPLESSLWVEFGTGEYALNGDGHKGYWVYINDGENHSASYDGKSYTKDEARRVVAMLRTDGYDAHYTKGQHPKRPLFNAFTTKKDSLKNRLAQILKGQMK